MESMDDATFNEAGRDTVASYATYVEAQRAVDALSDAGFPVDKVDIVGHGLSLVERVTGRLTTARAAGAGALSGAWFGPRSWAERAYPDNLIHYNRLDRGGHFAAWEQPELLSQELRNAFRTLR
jgi:hypothetical protein